MLSIAVVIAAGGGGVASGAAVLSAVGLRAHTVVEGVCVSADLIRAAVVAYMELVNLLVCIFVS